MTERDQSDQPGYATHWHVPTVRHDLTLRLDPDLMAILRQLVPPTPTTSNGAVLAAISAGVATVLQRIDTMSQTNQQHADDLAAQINAMDVTLKAGITAITDEITALKASAPAVDFTGLDAAVAALGTDVAAAAAIPPAPPAPPV